jgi:hypothetical protein
VGFACRLYDQHKYSGPLSFQQVNCFYYVSAEYYIQNNSELYRLSHASKFQSLGIISGRTVIMVFESCSLHYIRVHPG